MKLLKRYGSKMTEITVRAETPSDIQAIDVVNISAFQGEGEAQLVSELRNSTHYIPELSLVAEYKGRLVGHLMLSRVKILGIDNSPKVLTLAPMSVVPSQSSRGIGSVLLRAGIKKARQLGFEMIVEIGQTEYYKRHGFRPITEFGLRHSLNVSDEFITFFSLTEDHDIRNAELEFPPAFDNLFGIIT